jgi:hypothetical protein
MPECLEDYVTETNPVRVVDVFVDELELFKLGLVRVEPAVTGRPVLPSLSSFEVLHLRLPQPYPIQMPPGKKKPNATWNS